ncbi:MAG: ABC transporter permease [Ginsengibacter sp.]
MFKNYFKIALRNLKRNKIYSFINIAGLALGLACAMMIILYVKDEVSFDRFHKDVKDIYRVSSIMKFRGELRKDGNTGFLQGPRFTQNVPGIQSFVRVQSGTEDVKLGSEIQSLDLLYVDSSFFTVFTFPLLSGNPITCLTEPHSIVLTEDAAKKQFGNSDAIGKIVMVKEDSAFIPFKVTAIAKNCPQNSSIQFSTLLPFKESEKDAQDNDNWYNYFLNTFVVLEPKATVQKVEDQMQRFYVKDAKATFKKMAEQFDLGKDASMGSYFLQPFIAMHLSTELPAQNGLTNASDPMYSYILSGIALFILLIACINFVNLTVARSLKRAKEIGIRKVVGGNRKQLIMQFLGESFVLCLIAFLMALAIVQLVLPVFNSLSNKSLALSYLFDAKLITGYFILFAITTLLAGFYPALVLSGYSPVKTLYSHSTLSGKNYLQKSLVVLQFTLSSFLIIATLIIYYQFNYLTTEKLGYDDNNLVLVNKLNLKRDQAKLFSYELKKDPDIIEVAAKNSGSWSTVAKVNGDSSILFAYETVDESFLPLLKIPVLEGRNFSPDYPSDSSHAVLVNESFVKKAGWKNPIGKSVNFFFHADEKYTVIGVVKDYHFQSLNREIGPQLFTMKHDNDYGTSYIKIKSNTATASLKYIQSTFKKLFPLSPYNYTFKNEENIRSYEAEAKWKQIMLYSAILTIFISCIGLFGLSVLSAEKRTKEIGIRKVLGASVRSIVTVLSADFLKLVMLAMMIAIPLAWWTANKWLEKYPYRIHISWWIFASAGLLVIIIALITVSFQAIKAAVANPVDSLRSE